MDFPSLKAQFLVAMPSLADPHFDRAVTLMCEHDPAGAMGLIINRPTELRVSAMLEHLGVDHPGLEEDPPVYWGGPVQPERGFVLHAEAGDWESTVAIGDSLFLSASRDILAAIGSGLGPSRYLVVLGYAGWGPGQLEEEILRNSWLNTPLDIAILFDTPASERWAAATRLLGVDTTALAGDAGHA